MLDIQAEQYESGQPYQELYDAVVEMKRRHDLHPCAMQPRDGLALRVDGERERVQDLVSRFRRLPEDTRRRLPALLNSLAQLEIVIGDIEAGMGDFQEVTRIVSDPISRAEAHHNVYRAALERRDFAIALTDLRRAVALDGETFEPFPFGRLEPKQILGVGGFGPSFLCRDIPNERDVVVRAIRTDTLDRPIDVVLRELGWMQELDYPALIRIHEVGQHGPNEKFPFVVMEHFPGQTLGEYIAQNGALSPEDWMEIAWPIGRALQALHNRGILHRSLRPACVLVRKGKSGDGRNRLIVKVLEAAMGLKRAAIHASACNPDTHSHTSMGRSVARALAFLPPEIVGRPKGSVWVGPHSDFYSFGRLCAAGLTGRPDPDKADRMMLPEAWQKMLEDCLSWTIKQRPTHAGPVLDALAKLPDSDKMVARIERDLFEETVLDLTRILDKDPDDHAARVNRANAYYRQGEFGKAAADYGVAIGQRPGDAALYRRRAQSYSRSNQTDKAIADYTEALKLEPRDLESLANRGMAYAQKGEHEKAIADFTEGLRLAPRDETMYFNRGNAHSAREEYPQALHDYEEALRINPKHTGALHNRAKVHGLRGDLGKALSDFNRLLQLDPGNHKGLCDRAATYLELGHVDRAIADFTEAIRLERSAGLFHDRGLARLRQNDSEGAVSDFGEALAMSPNNPSLLMSRARALAQAGQQDEALADLDLAVEHAPQSASVLVQRGEQRSKMGRHREAVADLTEALRLAPNAAASLFARGLALAEMGEYDRSVADFSEVIRLDPDSSAAWTNRGTSHVRLGEYEAALEDYGKALALLPGDVMTLTNRAGLHTRLGDKDAAIADYGEVLRHDPGNGQAHASRGLLLADKGEMDAALNDLNAAVRLRPKDARAYNHRGHVHGERGELDKAIADYTEATKLDAGYALAWMNLALTHSLSGAAEAAVAAYDRVLEITPGDASALSGRAAERLALGDEEAALADINAALSADPAYATARYQRAELLRKRGDLAGALADYDEILKADPDAVWAYISRGRVHSLTGRFDLAIADNQAALARKPDDARVLNNLAWLHATSPAEADRNPTLAVEYARKACQDKEDAGHLDTLAAALAAAGEFAEASRMQRRAFELAAEGQKDDFLTRLVLYRAGKAYVQTPAEAGRGEGAG